ncbi:MAG: hypothetical protein ABSG55_01210 [Dehalococcoidia bacterium]|jgi:hypothetical protein
MAGLIKGTARNKWLGLLAALCVLGVGIAFWTGIALAGPSVPTPSISSKPANPTNQTSASFTYTDSQSITRFECKLDAGAFAACGTTRPSTKTYSGLAAGSHTFQVRAVSGSSTSSAASYTWTIDLTAPTVVSINRADPNPTKANPLHWTVTFSEPVKNVVAGNFGLVTSGLGGTAPTVNSVAPVGSAPTATWTVTAATNGTTGANNGSVGLNLTSKGTSPNQVQDAAGNVLGGSPPIAGQAYTFDTTKPVVTSISRDDPSPTDAYFVSWTVTFSEPVVGLNLLNFSLVQSGLTGLPLQIDVSGSGSTWTVTAWTGLGTPLDGSAGTLQLNLSRTVRVTDVAGNALASTFNGTAAVYRIDKFTPAPVITSKPPNPNSVSTSTFVWTEQEAGDTFLCSEENGPFNVPCSSPFTYSVKTTSNGMHQFGVEAVDALGNVSAGAFYSWKVAMGSIQNFTITGNLAGLLYPGGQTQPVAITLTNPNSMPIYVTSLTVSMSGGLPSGCSAGWFQINQSNVSSSNTVTIPANGSVALPHANSAGNGTVTAPTIQMTDSGNQDACKNATFSLSYSGSAHS